MKLYAVIDTNVLVSALLRWDSVPGAVLEQALIGSIVPLLSDEDVIFYAVTMEARKESDAYLVTGNIKHFPLKHYVVTPREMLTILENGGRPILEAEGDNHE